MAGCTEDHHRSEFDSSHDARRLIGYLTYCDFPVSLSDTSSACDH